MITRIARAVRQLLGEAPARSTRCVAPQDIAASPLLTELQALLDHAARLRWLANREHRPDAYREFAADVLHMLLDGWQKQNPGGSVADLVDEAARTARPLHRASWGGP